MASLPMEFVFSDKLRPCTINGEKALWHRWVCESRIVPPSAMRGGHNGGVVTIVKGLIEFPTGRVAFVLPEEVQFADSSEFFDEYCSDNPPKETLL